MMKPNLLHDLLHDVDSIMCKQTKHHVMLKCQSNVASKPALGMQGCTTTKDTHLTSLKAVGLRSLLHCEVYQT